MKDGQGIMVTSGVSGALPVGGMARAWYVW